MITQSDDKGHVSLFDENAEIETDNGTDTTADTVVVAETSEKMVAETNKDDENVIVNTKKEKSVKDFDWDTYSNTPVIYAADERAKMEAMYDATLSAITENEIVDGKVIAINKREVVVNIGYKSEGIISMNEFRYNPDLKIGDLVEVYVESSEDKKGQLLLSHKTARSLRSWDRVNKALENDEIITGYIKCRTKGGMIVDVFGIEAFLPGSQIDVKPIRDYDIFVGKTTEFKIVKINHDFKNVVVSHKALIEAELEQQKAEIISKLEKGQILEGIVKNITTYGVFIDLGGVDGLIHITDLSWGRVNHPEEIVQLDEKLNVVILGFDDTKKRIALGLKQLTQHPWDALDTAWKVGDVVSGKVVVMADYGAFVEVIPGVEGLIHVSEMSWSQHLRSAQDFLKVGDTVEAKILTLDRDDRKMSLGIKQLSPDPWTTIDEKYAMGSHHVAKVRNFTTFGVFVEIEEGIDGLIHISDLSWTKKVKHPSEYTQIGEEINVVVLEIDKESRRLSLGHKQLEENPWSVFETIFTVDSVHEGVVVDIFDKGAIVALQYGVEGYVSTKYLVKENGKNAKVDEKLNFKVLEFSKTSSRIILSHRHTYEDLKKTEIPAAVPKVRTEADEVKLAAKKLHDSLEKTTFGDITALSDLRDEMKASEKIKVVKKVEGEKIEDEALTAELEVAEATVSETEAVVNETETLVSEPEATEIEPEVTETDANTEVAEAEAEVVTEVTEVTETITEPSTSETSENKE
jgi:small subunit ribosomal protein S1